MEGQFAYFLYLTQAELIFVTTKTGRHRKNSEQLRHTRKRTGNYLSLVGLIDEQYLRQSVMMWR